MANPVPGVVTAWQRTRIYTLMYLSALTRHFMANLAPTPRPAIVLAVALGGILGAVARVYLPWPVLLEERLHILDPVPTAIVNLLGAALLGLVTGYTQLRSWPEPLIKGVTTGFLGTFTTMSAFAMILIAWGFGQSVIAAASISTSLLYGTAIAVMLGVFVWFTTVLTMATYKLGSRLARREP